jgi:site-specific DNA recombinase
MEGVWYRCNGQLQERGILEGKCPGKSIKGPNLEKVVWDDIERFLRNPGDILDELTKERQMNPQAERDEKDRATLEEAMRQIAGERQNAIRFGAKGTITDEELDELLTDNARREAAISERLNALMDSVEEEPEPINEDMLAQIRRRLEEGLSDEERQEIVGLLVKRITIHTEGTIPGKKTAKAVVEYRFSKTVVSDCTGKDSSSLAT